MQKIRELFQPVQVASIIADVAVLTYTFLYFYWMFFVENMDAHYLTDFFASVNPMTVGTYITGFAMLLHLVAFKNIIGRCLIATIYGFTFVVSIVAIMGMTTWKDLMIYVPHIVIIYVAIIILYKQHKEASFSAK